MIADSKEGLGFESLPIFNLIIESVVKHENHDIRWDDPSQKGEGSMNLAIIDADIAQAAQSCTEQLMASQDMSSLLDQGRSSVDAILKSLTEWQTRLPHTMEFPLERGLICLQSLRGSLDG